MQRFAAERRWKKLKCATIDEIIVMIPELQDDTSRILCIRTLYLVLLSVLNMNKVNSLYKEGYTAYIPVSINLEIYTQDIYHRIQFKCFIWNQVLLCSTEYQGREGSSSWVLTPQEGWYNTDYRTQEEQYTGYEYNPPYWGEDITPASGVL